MKKAIKAFIAGFLSCLLLSATIVWADTSGVMREVFYGVNVVVNGRTQSFDDDMQPFISNGRVFLPARAVAEVLNIPVDWDSTTATVYIGQKPQPRVNQNHLTVAATNIPWTLDPAGANDTNLALLSRQVFDT
ncbi:MAG: copper amine oxidase N-terminal domain-containing protein, partial [Defluviitaleaceae bacterium]|nr:copper amine oxidase N-terminal domain-containing protein [Defluviitaleaceae bacterium]